MPVKRESTLYRIAIAVVLYILSRKLRLDASVSLVLIIVAYLVAGINVIKRSFMDICRGEFFDENFLMLLATVGALVTRQYVEAISVMIIYEIGEMMQDKAVDDSKRAIVGLIDKRPKYVSIVGSDNIEKTKIDNVKVGDIIVVGAGESVSLDGIIIKGAGHVDFSALTGESVPKYLKEGDLVYSGCIINDATIHIRATKIYSESTLSKILDFIKDADNKKSRTERFMTKFSKRYTPLVLSIAVLFVLFAGWIDIIERINRACMFLVIACPCALVISLPLCFFYGIGLCSKRGILVKGSSYIEALSQIGAVVFDKTGTLTKGKIEVIKVDSINGKDTLELAAYCEAGSTHPIACAIKKAYNRDIDYIMISDAKEISGRGTSCLVRGEQVLVGSKKFMQENNIDISEVIEKLGSVYVARDGEYVGSIIVADNIRDESSKLVRRLKEDGISVYMMTGDSDVVACSVANELGIEQVYSEVFPEDKAKIVKDIMKIVDDSVIFVGDGINDVMSIMTADVGIAMGGVGSDAAIEASDVVIMDDDVGRIGQLVDVAKMTMHTAKTNIVMVLVVKSLVLVLCALGRSTMWGAILADVVVSMIAIMHSTRELKI